MKKTPFWPRDSASSAVVSLITPGTMGHLFQYSSEGNIFTTHRSMKKAAVSKDFCLCLPFFSLFPFYLFNFDVAKHHVWKYIPGRKDIHIFIPFRTTGWNHLAFRL